eukprot:CAMPEP_0197625916 /NCGR_PEP_ID=MMETSP1338-20131121/5132_1 /TAXON_ID=43686 ORGANISM="Pelagodinium beii, Strain RCC1491" /NCGR_SAMPLE_ID=MMETSP1338 /ASSEMBLY_ACC=CAM_ASM_000754 /LENGTH=317 /DNA_ID=CAMNT_0043196427 /DNA_START=69 /DNA_END=1020 /DNA_ORIENTATION=-
MVAEDQLSEAVHRRLADLKLLVVKQEIDRTKETLEEACTRHAAAADERRQLAENLKERQRRRKEREAERQRRIEAAKMIARNWRSHRLYRMQIAPLWDALSRRALAVSRHDLKTKILDLRRNVHSLFIEDSDKLRAALAIQIWWRDILFRRVEKVEYMYEQVQKVHHEMVAAASRIQAIKRMGLAKERTQYLRQEKIRSEEEAARRAKEIMLKAAVKVQSAYRKNKAIMEVQHRRAQMFAAVLSNGNEAAQDQQANKSGDGGNARSGKAQGTTGQRTAAKATAKGAPKRKRPVSDINSSTRGHRSLVQAASPEHLDA